MPEDLSAVDAETARWIVHLKQKIATNCFLLKVAGVHFPNDDGSSRQRVIATCQPRDWVELVHDGGNRYHRFAVKVTTEDGRQIGFLERSWGDTVCAGAKGGARFAAIIASIQPSAKRRVLTVQIAVFRLSSAYLAEQGKIAQTAPATEASPATVPEVRAEDAATAFEAWLIRTQPAADRRLIAKVRGVQHENAAGTSRQAILSELAPGTELEVGANDELTRVLLYTRDEQEIGYLDAATSRKVLNGVHDGTVWKAFAGLVGDVPSGKWKTLTVGLVRVPEIVAELVDPFAVEAIVANDPATIAAELHIVRIPKDVQVEPLTLAAAATEEFEPHEVRLEFESENIQVPDGPSSHAEIPAIESVTNLSGVSPEKAALRETLAKARARYAAAKAERVLAKANQDALAKERPVPPRAPSLDESRPRVKPPRFLSEQPRPSSRDPGGWAQTVEGRVLLLTLAALYVAIRLMMSCN